MNAYPQGENVAGIVIQGVPNGRRRTAQVESVSVRLYATRTKTDDLVVANIVGRRRHRPDKQRHGCCPNCIANTIQNH